MFSLDACLIASVEISLTILLSSKSVACAVTLAEGKVTVLEPILNVELISSPVIAPLTIFADVIILSVISNLSTKSMVMEI